MTILIADDDTSIIVALKLLLNSEGMASEACQTPAALLARIGEKNFKLALIDMNYGKDTTSATKDSNSSATFASSTRIFQSW